MTTSMLEIMEADQNRVTRDITLQQASTWLISAQEAMIVTPTLTIFLPARQDITLQKELLLALRP